MTMKDVWKLIENRKLIYHSTGGDASKGLYRVAGFNYTKKNGNPVYQVQLLEQKTNERSELFVSLEQLEKDLSLTNKKEILEGE